MSSDAIDEKASYRMRCPGCQKTYSVQRQAFFEGVSAPKFRCSACAVLYQAILVDEFQRDGIETMALAGEISESPAQNLALRKISLQASFEQALDSRETGERPPRKLPNRPEVLEIAKNCPKCSEANRSAAMECQCCGVIFAKHEGLKKFANVQLEKTEPNNAVTPKELKAKPSNNLEISFSGRHDLHEQWNDLLLHFSELSAHEKFIANCLENQCLPFASAKYSGVLLQATSNNVKTDIAKSMRKRIVMLAEAQAQMGTKSDPQSTATPSGILSYGRFKLNDIVLCLGSLVMTMGFFLPGFRDLTGLGIATMALSVGVRLMLTK